MHRTRLWLLLALGLLVVAALLSVSAAPAVTPRAVAPVAGKQFEIRDGHFLLDGKPMVLVSGEMHYPRIPYQYWRHRLRMAKACGLNAITTYVFWNVHEPEKGHFNFQGNADIAKFIRTAQEEGLWVILRPGPYVCAEWDFGGLPYWLLTEKGLRIRTRDPRFLDYVDRYFRALGKQLAPLQISSGGNILMAQVENEYGSYSNDKVYLGQVRNGLRDAGFTVPLFTCDGGSQMSAGYLPGILPGFNGGSGPEIRQTIDRFHPGGPYFVPEYYPGWLDHWGEPKSMVGTAGIVRNTERMLQNGISFNYYMFHGGTNFGFTSGANFGGTFQPDLTSYDYDAPLDEAGRATPKYLQIRETLRKYLPPGTTLPDMPPANPIIRVPRFALKELGSLLGALPKPIHSDSVRPMEEFGQAYGFILYRTTVQGPLSGKLTLKDLRDYAVVMVNGKRVGLLDRRRNSRWVMVDLPAGRSTLDILVENCGRINYGGLLPDNKKGITASVSLGEQELEGWDIYPLPFQRVTGLHYDGKSTDGPTLRRGTFTLAQTGDTFLDMRGWYKGVVWVNGMNLGRFWEIGPQQTLYVPGPWLKRGVNEIMVLDLAPTGHTSVEGIAEPVLSDLRPEEPLRKARPTPAILPNPTPAERIAAGEFNAGDDPQDVRFGPQSGRYLCFQAIDSYNGDYASCAELYLLNPAGLPLSRASWKIYYASSEESAQEDGSAENMIDDDPATIWHSVWSQPHASLPHFVVIDLGKETTFSGMRYLARQGDKPAKTRHFALYLSDRPFTGRG